MRVAYDIIIHRVEEIPDDKAHTLEEIYAWLDGNTEGEMQGILEDNNIEGTVERSDIKHVEINFREVFEVVVEVDTVLTTTDIDNTPGMLKAVIRQKLESSLSEVASQVEDKLDGNPTVSVSIELTKVPVKKTI